MGVHSSDGKMAAAILSSVSKPPKSVTVVQGSGFRGFPNISLDAHTHIHIYIYICYSLNSLKGGVYRPYIGD